EVDRVAGDADELVDAERAESVAVLEVADLVPAGLTSQPLLEEEDQGLASQGGKVEGAAGCRRQAYIRCGFAAGGMTDRVVPAAAVNPAAVASKPVATAQPGSHDRERSTTCA